MTSKQHQTGVIAHQYYSASELRLLLLFYISLGMLYWIGFYLQNKPDWAMNVEFFKSFLFRVIMIQPFYYLMFYKFRPNQVLYTVLLHICYCLIFIGIWLSVIRLSSGWMREFEVFGNSFYYDTALIYLFTFGFFHAEDYFKVLEEHQVREQELLLLNHEIEKNVLSAQMHPHFLFNILNSINASVPAQLEATRESVAKLAQTYRYILNASKIDETLLSLELNFFADYLALENDPNGKVIHFEIKAPEIPLSKQKCPPMFLHSAFIELTALLQHKGCEEIDCLLEIRQISEGLRYETTLTLSTSLSREVFLEIAVLNAESKHNGYVRDFNIFQVSDRKLFIIFFTSNNFVA